MTRPSRTFTKAAALELMEEAGGHAFLWPEVGVAIGAAFGLTLTPQVRRANTGDPKGLSVDGVGRNAKVEGYSVYDLAEEIAESIPDGPEPLPRIYRCQEGRGSRARSACETIRAHLTRTGEVIDEGPTWDEAMREHNAPPEVAP